MRGAVLLALIATGLLTAGCQPKRVMTGEGLALSVPDDWIWKVEEIEGKQYQRIQPPEDQQDKHSHRKIHLGRPKVDTVTPEQAAKDEMASIDERSHGRPSSNGSLDFRGLTTIKTKSGIEGVKADFANDTSEGTIHGIVKYYFRDRDGRVVRVCAHVYGGYLLDQQYEKLIVDRLSFAQ